MKYSKATCIVGPTGSGKTEVAYKLARQAGGEVINLDKAHIYKGFSISTGLTDVLQYKDIKKHLYLLLDPDEPIYPPGEYIKMVKDAVRDILSRNKLPIIEGGSTTYFPELYQENQKSNFISPIIGLLYPSGVNIKDKFRQRLEAAFQAGLLDEIKEALKKYRNTLLMTTGHAIIPLVKYLDGEINLDVAKEEILDRAMEYSRIQLECFKKYPDIIWKEGV